MMPRSAQQGTRSGISPVHGNVDLTVVAPDRLIPIQKNGGAGRTHPDQEPRKSSFSTFGNVWVARASTDQYAVRSTLQLTFYRKSMQDLKTHP